jgi:hypothetical protein
MAYSTMGTTSHYLVSQQREMTANSTVQALAAVKLKNLPALPSGEAPG